MSLLLQQSEATAAQRRWFFVCVDDTDGKTPETGLTFSSGELQLSKNGAAFANFGGTVTELTDGLYYYEATATELNTLGALAFKIEKTGVRTTVMHVGQVVPWDPYDTVRLGMTALPNAAAAASGGLFVRGTGAGAINQDANGRIDVRVVNMDANTVTASAVADGAIDAGAIASDAITAAKIASGAITAAKFAADAITSTVIADDAITAAKLATGAISADGLATDAVTEIVAAVEAELSSNHGAGSWEGAASLHTGTAQAGAAQSITLASSASTTNGIYVDAVVRLTGGTGAGQTNQIIGYVGSSRLASVARAWAVQPDASSTYELLPAGSPLEAARLTWEGVELEAGFMPGDLLRFAIAAAAGRMEGLDAVRAAGGNGDVTFYAMDGVTVRFVATMSTDGRMSITLGSLAA